MAEQALIKNNSMLNICKAHCSASGKPSAPNMTHAIKEHCGKMNNAYIYTQPELLSYKNQCYHKGVKEGYIQSGKLVIYIAACIAYEYRYEIWSFAKDKYTKITDAKNTKKNVKNTNKKTTKPNANLTDPDNVDHSDSDLDTE